MSETITAIISGLVFGLSGGLSPGPLLTLVISETLKHGVSEGVKIAMAPLVTDLPIVAAALYLLARLSDMTPVIGTIYLVGGAFLCFLGYESIVFKGAGTAPSVAPPQSLRKGIVANFLNPSPYLFWISIGAPTVIAASKHGLTEPIVFITIFYICLVGSKILVTLLVGKSKRFLSSGHYIYTIRILGCILILFAMLFFKNGIQRLMGL